jgi:hypothetical protein
MNFALQGGDESPHSKVGASHVIKSLERKAYPLLPYNSSFGSGFS